MCGRIVLYPLKEYLACNAWFQVIIIRWTTTGVKVISIIKTNKRHISVAKEEDF